MRLRDPREPAAFALVVLVGFVVARFVGVAVHEVLGHGLFAQALGGVFYGAYVSPGSGFALVFLPPDAPAAFCALVSLAGILVEVLLGIGVLLAYPRVRTFLGRLFALLLLVVLFVFSFVYLILGSLDATGGDAAHAVVDLGAPHLTAAFIVVGALWAVAAASAISMEVLRLAAPRGPARRQLLILGLFWFTPLASVVPGIVLGVPVSAALLLYFLLFVAVGGAIFVVASVLVTRLRIPRPPPEARATGSLAPLAVAFVLVLAGWLVPFGPTEATAHGVLFGDPPLAAEPDWASPQAIGVRARLTRDLGVVLEFRFKGVPSLGGPLEESAWATYEDRAYFPYWIDAAQSLAGGITNVTRVAWNATDAYIDPVRAAWFGGGELANPRIVVLEANATYRPLLANVTTVGAQTFVTLAAYDPYRSGRAPCEGCFLDEVELAWPGTLGSPGFALVNITAVGGRTPPTVSYDAADDLYVARYRNLGVADAASLYVVTLERLP